MGLGYLLREDRAWECAVCGSPGACSHAMSNATPQPLKVRDLDREQRIAEADKAAGEQAGPPPVPAKRGPREDRAHRLREDR